MRPVVKGLLSLSIICVIYLAGCSSESDLAGYYHDLDSTAFLSKLSESHFEVRVRLLDSLSEYLKIKASGNPGDRLYNELNWLITLYYDTTGIRDLTYRLSSYAAWDTTQSRQVLALRDTQGKLLRGRDTLSLSALRHQLEENRRGFEQLGDSIYLAVVAKDIAQAFEAHDQIDSAVHYYRDCLAICRRLDYYSLMGNCEMLLGRIYNYRLADYLQSERAYGNAIRSFRKIDDERFIPFVQLGRIYDFLQLYQTETAISLIHDILPGLKDRKDRDNEAYCYYFLSVAYNNLGLSDSALYFGERSVERRRKLALKNSAGLSDLGYSMSQLGLIYHNRGNDNQALEIFRAADSIFSSVNDSAGAAVNLIGWGNLFIEAGAIDSARAKFEKIAGNNSSYENFLCARYGLAICDYYQGSFDHALTQLQNCIWLVEHANRKLPVPQLKTGILSDKIGFYNLTANIFIDLFDTTGDKAYADSAFIYIERSKSRALIDNLSGDFHQAPDSVENRYLHLLAEAYRVGRESGDTEKANKTIHDLEDSLLLRYVEFPRRAENDIGNFAEPSIDIAAFQKEFHDAKTVLLEYSLSNLGNFVFIIGRDSFMVRNIDLDFDSLQVLINNYLEVIDSYPGDSQSATAYEVIGQELYTSLIPAEELTTFGAERLIIAASGPLHYLPLESLVDKDNRFLVEYFDVSYIPSATAYRLIAPRKSLPKVPRAVAFASSPPSNINDTAPAPTSAGPLSRSYWAVDHLAPLPSCSVEVRILAECFGPDQIKMYIGDEATEANFKNIDFSTIDYLHIAAHGITDDRLPSRSAIIFSTVGDDENDGLLRPREISQMEIPGRLVFLSSCRSGGGKSFPGEGVLNLARPFLIAGCQSAVVTYWNIGDITTAEFAGYFYHYLLSGHSHAHALALAKRQFIQSHRSKHRHPYFWAPFVLIGS